MATTADPAVLTYSCDLCGAVRLRQELARVLVLGFGAVDVCGECEARPISELLATATAALPA